jgi:glucosyl-3-phosphoglycerate synthase
VRAAAQQWFSEATSVWFDWTEDDLLARKQSHRISVVIPAHNEEATIGGIIEGIRARLVDDIALVDEIVVIDSDSTDDTARVASACQATVHAARNIQPQSGAFVGKGEALWKSLFVTTGDLLVFIDADLTEWGPHFVSGLLGPLLADPAIKLVKGYYDRVLEDGSGRSSVAGGRVTELVARPLLNMFWPELAAVVQPLAGEWAIRRETFESLHVPIGYGVEIAALLDVWTAGGLPAIAQVDLGQRAHSHQSEHDLGLMAAEILVTAARRAGMPENLMPNDASMAQFSRTANPVWRERSIPIVQRPPAITIDGYRHVLDTRP